MIVTLFKKNRQKRLHRVLNIYFKIVLGNNIFDIYVSLFNNLKIPKLTLADWSQVLNVSNCRKKEF